MLSTEADLLSGNPESAMRVQEAIGSRSSAIHKDYRASLRPSKVPEPRYPSLKVVVLDHHPFQKACANYLTLELTNPATGQHPRPVPDAPGTDAPLSPTSSASRYFTTSVPHIKSHSVES